ncbi:MAG: metal-sensing transcriptional repressor [Curvibacter sp.]|nr:metal-sensing transcriptional repressor [Curvibacter sp.]
MSTMADPARKKALQTRLARVEGQLRGIQRMIDEDADCEKIAQQLAAARKALDKSFFNMVGCLIEQGGLPPAKVAELLAKFA